MAILSFVRSFIHSLAHSLSCLMRMHLAIRITHKRTTHTERVISTARHLIDDENLHNSSIPTHTRLELIERQKNMIIYLPVTKMIRL